MFEVLRNTLGPDSPLSNIALQTATRSLYASPKELIGKVLKQLTMMYSSQS